MWHDEIVEEVRRLREEYSLRFHNDIAAMVADARKRQNEEGREVVSFGTRRGCDIDRGSTRPASTT